ncbi:hypothetical protein CVD28_00635 [Bacillus sp. M6-12]|uniref:DUF488 family protein, N3 subclade n=1 Tax=Bacillus sp. M6-12 TaxID=2054166 RepID=UPI000C7921FF|nr:hypothetical protein [Bacillus sp. M6-12]PLS18939.1 hypothetical protein CVD28_00635 [Bacillus sp. M6-12]
MLHLAYLGESKQIIVDSNTLRMLIVRKPVSGIPGGFIHVPQLSPSLQLFDHNRKTWKQGLFTEEDIAYLHSIQQTEDDPEAWWFLYEREFNKELVSRPDMVRAIERLGERLKQGVEIYTFCYCKNVCRCHRGLLGKHMQDRGFEVDFRKKQEPMLPVTKPLEQLSLFD